MRAAPLYFRDCAVLLAQPVGIQGKGRQNRGTAAAACPSESGPRSKANSKYSDRHPARLLKIYPISES